MAGGVASVCGFGIGSLLTPPLANEIDMRLAVAIVSVPHFVATLQRFVMLRKHVNKSVLLHFGILSALGGLCGALIHNTASDPTLKCIFGLLLMFSGFSGLTGLMSKIHMGKPSAWVAGGLSGMFGGMVGNQGGIRSAALLAFDMTNEEFVATATAIGLIVDLARMPVYIALEANRLGSQMFLIILLTVGCVIGTKCGAGLLKRIPAERFKLIVSSLILLLGIQIFLSSS